MQLQTVLKFIFLIAIIFISLFFSKSKFGDIKFDYKGKPYIKPLKPYIKRTRGKHIFL
mgnify:CR=1 FL=1|jgi:hypothetical protein